MINIEELERCNLTYPETSVVIPTMNLEEWRVKNCLWSLRQQTEQNIEVIISDINSDAEHLEQLRQLSRQFDAALYHLERDVWSIAVAYNVGLRRSRGKYAGTIDADIIFEPGVIEDTLMIFGGRENCTVIRQPVFLGVGVDNSSRKFPASYAELSRQPEIYQSPSLGSFFVAPTSWWNGVHGYDERFQMYGLEDWEIWRRAGKSKMRKVLIGCAHRLKFPKQPPREGCKLYHQFHQPFQKRAGVSMEDYEEYRKSNQLIYGGDSSIVRNDENWGLM